MLTGQSFSGQQGVDWGLLDGVFDAQEFESAVRQTIDRLLPFHPVALQMARRLLNESFATNYEDFLGHFLAANTGQ